MNILLIVKNFDFGGAENHVCELANQLDKQGHKIVVISKQGRQVHKHSKSIIHIQNKLSDFNIWINLPWFIKLVHNEHIQIIHGHQRIAIVAATLLSKLTEKPSIATIHEKIRHDLRSEFVTKQLHKVIAVSGNSFIGTQRNKLLINKSALIHNDIKKVKNKTELKQNKSVYIYGSRFDQRHTRVIEILNNSVWPSIVNLEPDAQLQLDSDGPQMPLIDEKAKALNAEFHKEDIKLVGYKKSLTKRVKYAAMVLGVGRVAIEALSVGVPVLLVNALHGGKIITTQNYEYMHHGNFVDIDVPPVQSHDVIKKTF